MRLEMPNGADTFVRQSANSRLNGLMSSFGVMVGLMLFRASGRRIWKRWRRKRSAARRLMWTMLSRSSRWMNLSRIGASSSFCQMRTISGIMPLTLRKRRIARCGALCSVWFTAMSFSSRMAGMAGAIYFITVLDFASLCRVRSRIWLPESFVSVWVLRTMTRGSPRLIRLQGKMSVRR